MSLRTDAEKIMQSAITASLPDTAVEKALQHKELAKEKLCWWPLARLPGKWPKRPTIF